MKRIDYNAILETHAEVYDVFFMPSWWGYRSGGAKCGFCAAYHCLKVSEKEAEKFSVDFESKSLELYWNNLYWTERYCDFCFESGKEIDEDDRPIRGSDNIYLKAAKYISSIGVQNFTVRHVLGEGYQGILFENNKGNSFMFKDVVDIRMYLSAEEVYHNIINSAKNDDLKMELEIFTKD